MAAVTSARRADPYVNMRAYFGSELRHWRRHRGLTQEELGRHTGDSADLVRKIELAERWPPEGFSARADRALDAGGALERLEPWVARERQAEQRPDTVIDPAAWTHRFSHGPLETTYLSTSPLSEADLLDRLRTAQHRVNIFGLTRRFYARDHVRPVLEEAARRVPVRIYMVDPDSPARVERYRIEHQEAALEDPNRMRREVLTPLLETARRVADHSGTDPEAGIQLYLVNFPAQHSIEEIDHTIRFMPYGHGPSNAERPIFVLRAGTPYHAWFSGQIRWLESLASGVVVEPWRARGVVVRELTV
jgi:transcriptional regulator with XRE-family HTH domain